MPNPSRSLVLATLALAALPAARAQEYELRTGRRIPASAVRVTPEGFSATVPQGPNSTETIPFTVKDILRVSLPEPKSIAQARVLTASGKPQEAIAEAEKAAKEFDIIKSIPGSWWGRAKLVQMDALATAGKAEEAIALVNDSNRNRLPDADAKALQEFIDILGNPRAEPEERIPPLRKCAESASDTWLCARAWLEIGNLLANRGRVEEAIKAWLRVPTLLAAESDLAFRGTVAAARGLQQIERPEDGVKLLKDYLADNPASPYLELVNAEIAKLTPKKKKSEGGTKGPEAPANSTTPATEPAPAAPADTSPTTPTDQEKPAAPEEAPKSE